MASVATILDAVGLEGATSSRGHIPLAPASRALCGGCTGGGLRGLSKAQGHRPAVP